MQKTRSVVEETYIQSVWETFSRFIRHCSSAWIKKEEKKNYSQANKLLTTMILFGKHFDNMNNSDTNPTKYIILWPSGNLFNYSSAFPMVWTEDGQEIVIKSSIAWNGSTRNTLELRVDIIAMQSATKYIHHIIRIHNSCTKTTNSWYPLLTD